MKDNILIRSTRVVKCRVQPNARQGCDWSTAAVATLDKDATEETVARKARLVAGTKDLTRAWPSEEFWGFVRVTAAASKNLIDHVSVKTARSGTEREAREESSLPLTKVQLRQRGILCTNTPSMTLLPKCFLTSHFPD